MNVSTIVKMDLAKPDACLTVNAVQGDAYSRSLKLSLFNGGLPWAIPEGVTAAVRYAKPDHTKGYYDTLPDGRSAWEVLDNVLTIHLAPQMLTAAGYVKAQILLIQGDRTLSTFSLGVYVEADPAAGVLKSEDYRNWLQWIREQSDVHAQSVQQSAENALTASQAAETAAAAAADAAGAADTARSDAQGYAAEAADLVTSSRAYSKQESDLRYSRMILSAAEGEILSTADSAAAPLRELRLLGKTTQSGTPTPSAPLPLTSIGSSGTVTVKRIGKNLLLPDKFPATSVKNGISFVNNGDGSFNLSGTATATTTFSFGWNTDGSNLADIMRQGGRFVFFCDGAAYNGSTFNCSVGYRVDGVAKYLTANGAATDVPAGAEYQNISLWIPSGTTVTTITNGHLQLELGNGPTGYEPYTEKVVTIQTPNGLPGIPVSANGNYTDKNGQQWLCDEVELMSGNYVQRIGKFLLKDLEVSAWSSLGYVCENAAFQNAGELSLAVPCTHFASAAVQPDALELNSICMAGGKVYFRVDTSLYPSEEDFRAFLQTLDGYILYALAVPAEAEIAPAAVHATRRSATLLNDGAAHMKASYEVDILCYIDRKVAALA